MRSCSLSILIKKMQIKLRSDTISYPLNWPQFQSLAMLGAHTAVSQWEPSPTAGGDTVTVSKEFGMTQQCRIWEYVMIPQFYSYKHALKTEAVRFEVSLFAVAKTGDPNVHQQQREVMVYSYDRMSLGGGNDSYMHLHGWIFRNSGQIVTWKRTYSVMQFTNI